MWELLFPLKYLAIVASQAATPELSEAGYSQVKQPVCHTSFNPATPTCTCSQKEARHRDADGFGGWGRRRRKSCSHHYASFVCDYTENIYDFHKGMGSQNYNIIFSFVYYFWYVRVWMKKHRNTAVATLPSPRPEQHSPHRCHMDNSSNDAALSRFAAKRHGEGEGGETGFCRAQARSGASPFEVNQANAMKIKGGEKLEMKRGPRKKRALCTSCTTLHVSSILSSIA